MNKCVLIGIAVLLVLCSMTHATVWYVHPDSTLNSIQAGIGLCSTGDTVLVGAGTYIENINFNGMAITVTSEYGSDTTIIDGGSPVHPDSGSVVSFVSGEDTTSVLSGFTIMNGSGTSILAYIGGGGIFCYNNSSPTITDNNITGNNAEFGGGIVCYLSSSPIITGNTITANFSPTSGGGVEVFEASYAVISNNIITGNRGYDGAGVSSSYSYPIISDNYIADNISDCYGGGITMNWSGGTITDNIITGNHSDIVGGGIDVGMCSPALHISRNIITDNTAPAGGGIRCYMAAPVIDSCTFANNHTEGIYCHGGSMPSIHHCNIYGHSGNGVRNTDSSFTVNAENCWWGDPTGPYHLSSNPGGLGDTVSDYVDFEPWLTDSVQGIGIQEIVVSQPSLLNLQVSPNPFRHLTDIRYQMTDISNIVNMKIYDATGRLVRQWGHLTMRLSDHICWDGTDQANRQLPSGVYFVKFMADDNSATQKLLLIR